MLAAMFGSGPLFEYILIALVGIPMALILLQGGWQYAWQRWTTSRAPVPSGMVAAADSEGQAMLLRVHRGSRVLFFVGIGVAGCAAALGGSPPGNTILEAIWWLQENFIWFGVILAVWASTMARYTHLIINQQCTHRDRWSYGPVVWGGGAALAIALVSLLAAASPLHADDWVFVGVEVLIGGCTVGCLVRWCSAIWSPVPGSWLTRPTAISLLFFLALELLLVLRIALYF